MMEVPKDITLASLEVVVMPNGEVICNGGTVGWVKTLGRFLTSKQPIVRPPTKRKPKRVAI